MSSMAKRKSYLALPPTIDVVFLHLHLRAMPQEPFEHESDFGGRTRLELRINTGGVFLDVPIDHHPATAVAHVPFREEILIPGPELLGIGGTRGGAFPPDVGSANTEDRVDDCGNRVA